MTCLIEDLIKREMDNKFSYKFRDKQVFSSLVINRLTLESELKGHDGCVNCLEWNKSGTILASGSDDLKLMLWDAFERKLLTTIETSHRGNIFSVKFLNCGNDSLLASCAADRDIYVYDVNKNLKINEIHSHLGRVKRLETSCDEPYLLWSAGEDGLVLQHDIRCASGGAKSSCSNILINYSICVSETKGYPLEAKCISINPVRSELLAVGANDPYARVYDRRMLSLTSISNRNTQSAASTSTNSSISKSLFEFNLKDSYESTTTTTTPPITYYVPGHLPSRVDEYRKRMKNLSITFLTFSPNGKELLVNLGGEQLYLYDLSTQSSTNNNNFKFKHDSFRRMLTNTTTTTTIKEHGFEINMDEENCLPQKKTKVKLPPKAEGLKQKANSSFEEQNYLEAIEFYNRAIQMAPDSPILYGNRAAALMKRNWDGDVYMAMLDCYQSLSLDSMHLKSHFRLAKCLNDLKWHDEANDCLKVFCKRFPDYAKTNACENLLQEIQHCLSNLKKIQEKAKYIEKNRKLKSKLKNYTAYMSENYNRQETEPTDETSTPDIDMTRSDFFHDTTDEDENDENESSKISPTSADNNGSSGSGDDESKELHLINESMQKTSKKPSKSKLMLKEYKQLKVDANDLKSRYCGHCNVATDIKEANFLGDHFICAGSDDGSFFIWDKATSNVIRVLKGDESIVNCLQPHPFAACLATSGIDPCVRIWAPKRNQINGGDDDDSSTTTNDVHVVSDVRAAVLNNQTQMNSHPFEFLFLNLNNQNRQNFNDDDGDDTSATQQSVACRPS